MASLRDSRGGIHEIDFYEIEGLCEELTHVASNIEKYRVEADKIKSNVTRLSSSFEICTHVLNWRLLDPFCKNETFELGADGLPIMTDEFIGYSRELDSSKMIEGIIDEKGFISFENFVDKEQAASIVLMYEMFKNKELYLNYSRSRVLDKNLTAYDFLVSRPNVVGISRPNPLEEKFVLSYVSANEGRIADFIEYLKDTNKLADLDMKVQPESDLMEIKGR